VALVRDGDGVERAKAGETVQIALNQTPFYAESGGQVGDTGVIRTEGGLARVTDTRKSAGVFIHFAEVTEGEIARGAAAVLEVDHARRTAIRANHSATHLLHEALRHALGDHVAQRGSLNAADRLRFDFSHAKALSGEELERVEAEVNDYIRQNAPVETRIMTPDDARDLGAQALFGEKYGDEVRVVSMGEQPGSGKGGDGRTYSLELCGGTHVRRTGDIGEFVLLGDSASSAGVRRIEALTGQGAQTYTARMRQLLSELQGELKTAPEQIVDRVRADQARIKELSNELAQLRRDLAMAGGGQAAPEAKDIRGVKFLAQILTGVTGKDLPPLIDEHKARLGSGVVLLIADTGGKVAVAAGVTDDLTDKIKAPDLLRPAVEALGGKGGGGRPDMAQGGGNDISKADAAIRAAEQVLEG